MKKVAKVSELKASLSKYLARVKAGEEVVVTERGRPIAKIVPLTEQDDPEIDRMREMERKGLVTVGTGHIPDRFFDLPRPEDPEGLVLKALLDERRTGR